MPKHAALVNNCTEAHWPVDQSPKAGLKHASKIVPNIALRFAEQITLKVKAEQRKKNNIPPTKLMDEWILQEERKKRGGKAMHVIESWDLLILSDSIKVFPNTG